MHLLAKFAASAALVVQPLLLQSVNFGHGFTEGETPMMKEIHAFGDNVHGVTRSFADFANTEQKPNTVWVDNSSVLDLTGYYNFQNRKKALGVGHLVGPEDAAFSTLPAGEVAHAGQIGRRIVREASRRNLGHAPQELALLDELLPRYVR